MPPMANFPTPTQIVETLNDKKSFTPQGAVEAAKYIHGLAQQFGLGATRLVKLPDTPQFEQYVREEPNQANVVIEAGTGTEEMLFFHGHFDVVPPQDYGNKPYSITKGMNGELHGLGSYDMLPGIAAILTALRDIKIDKRRRIRAVLVFGEERDSEGTHAAFDASDNLFAFSGRRAALSTEITVGATIDDPYHLVIGRPGRFTYELELEGRMKHAGSVRASDIPHTTLQRLAKAEAAIMSMNFSRHPNDTLNLMQGTASFEYAGSRPPGSLSMSGEGYGKINVHYANPQESGADIQRRLCETIARALGDERFIIEKIERTLPWLQPWLEEIGPGTFAETIKGFAMRAVADRQPDVGYRVGPGTADECIIGQHMPVVCIPPKGGNAHEETEHGNINSVTEYMVPTLQAAAAYDGQLIPDPKNA